MAKGVLLASALGFAAICTSAPAGADWGEYVLRVKCEVGAGVEVEPMTLWNGEYHVNGHELRAPTAVNRQKIGANTYLSVRNRYAIDTSTICRPSTTWKVKVGLKNGRFTITDTDRGRIRVLRLNVDEDIADVWSNYGPTFKLKSAHSGTWAACQGKVDRPASFECRALNPTAYAVRP
jgi:hypothetical protein